MLDLAHWLYIKFSQGGCFKNNAVKDDWYFDYAYFYAFNISVFIISLIYSASAPLIAILGFIYFFLRVSLYSPNNCCLAHDRQIQLYLPLPERVWIDGHPCLQPPSLHSLWPFPLSIVYVRPPFVNLRRANSRHSLFLHGCHRICVPVVHALPKRQKFQWRSDSGIYSNGKECKPMFTNDWYV